MNFIVVSSRDALAPTKQRIPRGRMTEGFGYVDTFWNENRGMDMFFRNKRLGDNISSAHFMVKG